jgi:hypothetical protein
MLKVTILLNMTVQMFFAKFFNLAFFLSKFLYIIIQVEVKESNMKTFESEFAWEENEFGERLPALEIVGDDKPLTVTGLRDFLDYLIEEGYGDYDVEADTQDGSSYNVRDEVRILRMSKIVTIF